MARLEEDKTNGMEKFTKEEGKVRPEKCSVGLLPGEGTKEFFRRGAPGKGVGEGVVGVGGTLFSWN